MVIQNSHGFSDEVSFLLLDVGNLGNMPSCLMTMSHLLGSQMQRFCLCIFCQTTQSGTVLRTSDSQQFMSNFLQETPPDEFDRNGDITPSEPSTPGLAERPFEARYKVKVTDPTKDGDVINYNVVTVVSFLGKLLILQVKKTKFEHFLTWFCGEFCHSSDLCCLLSWFKADE